MKNIKIYCDGGSRGNPGKAACAISAVNENGEEIFFNSKYLGINTNNFAEYNALLLALEFVQNNYDKFDDFEIIMDSELVVKQMNGIYKVKAQSIIPLFISAMSTFKQVKSKLQITHIKRAGNARADELVNITLDEN